MITRIVGVVVEGKTIHLFMQDGGTETVPQAPWRVGVVKNVLLPTIQKQGYVDMDMHTFKVEGQIESLTEGRVKLTWGKVKDFLGFKRDSNDTMDRDAQILDTMPAVEHPENVPIPLSTEQPQAEGHTYGVRRKETHMVATVGNTNVPGVENLSKHMERAVAQNSAVGLENFLGRIANVIVERSHSIDELLHFMSRADLPIADDGRLVAYKVLKRAGDHYVDCRSRKIPQKVGSVVEMTKDRVNPSRRMECASGYHIARRGYIGNFSGNVCVLVKVAPEDVIAVPHNEPNKMRVMRYQIVGEIPKPGYDLLRNDQPMTSDRRSSDMLGAALAGHLDRVLETVSQAANGTVKVTPGQAQPDPKDEATIINAARAYSLDEEAKPSLDGVKEIQDAIDAGPPEELLDTAEDMDDTEVEFYCDDCGAVIEEGEEICDDCMLKELEAEAEAKAGTDVPDKDDGEEAVCPKCGGDKPESEDLCEDCFIDQEDAEQAEVEAPAKPTASDDMDPDIPAGAPGYKPSTKMWEEYLKLPEEKQRALGLKAAGLSQALIQQKTGVSRKEQWRLAQRGF